MAAYRQEQEVLSKRTVSLEAQMSLALQSQPKEPQLTHDPAQEPHPIGETGEGQDLSGVGTYPTWSSTTYPTWSSTDGQKNQSWETRG